MNIKRIFDFIAAAVVLLLLLLPMAVFWVLSSWDTRSNGLFCQIRVGQYGSRFIIFKLKTLEPSTGKISILGRWLRRHKIDEWPQLVNVLKGDMSLVGPRPDIPGYYDQLEGENRKVLELRPGITSEASIKYRNEEQLLQMLENPLQYNDETIFPDKVQMNLEYYYNRSFLRDLVILWKTVL